MWRGFGSDVRPDTIPLSAIGDVRCPVGGMPINRDLLIDTDAGTVYFCCEHCIEKFIANPQTFQEGVEAQRRALAADAGSVGAKDFEE